MTSQMRVYFMGLVGGVAGLTCWSIVTMAGYVVPQIGDSFFSDAFTMAILGGALGALAVAFWDYWSEEHLVPVSILSGFGIGMGMGLVSGLLAGQIQTYLGVLGRVIPWV